MIPFVTRISLPRYLLALVGIVLIWSIATQAKLTLSSSVLLASLSAPIYETDFAFDTETNVGLGVFRQSGTFKVRGVYMGPTGQPQSAAFDITTSAATEIRGPRVAARSGGGGGFLVTYFISEIRQKRAIFVQPSEPTLPSVLIDEATWSSNNNIGGVAYVAEHDAFLVVYRKDSNTFIKWVKVVGGTLVVSPSAVQLTSGGCNYVAPEIAWDFERDRALVTGWIDGCGGGVWMRRVSFNGSTISTLGSQATIAGGAEDVRVAFSDLMDRWLIVYVRRATTTPRHVFGNTVDPNGVIGSLRTILPANTSNSTISDDRFGRDNGLGLAYNPISGRFLVGVRGHDDGDGLAPLYAVELDTSGVVIPKTFVEVLSFDVMSPWPRLAAVPNSQNFLMMAKAGLAPAGSFSQLRSIRIAADGLQGTGNWPLADGEGAGGDGGQDPPDEPPPAPSGSFTLTITRPTNGLIVGPDIWCGTTSSSGTRCSVTKPAGTAIWLNAYPASGYALTSWGGCSASFALNANKSCAPTFGSTSPLPPPAGAVRVVHAEIARPTNGLIVGPDIWCGTTSATGTRCTVTKPAGTAIWLNAYPAAGHTLTSWGGCSPNFPLNANKSCAPTFSP